MVTFKRKNFLINPKLQITTMVIALILGMVSGLVVYYVFTMYFEEALSLMEANGLGLGHPVYDYTLNQKDHLLWFLMIVTVWVSLLNTVILLFFTHKIAGPAHRLKLSMEEMLRGEFDRPVKLRKGDFFKDTAELLDQIRLKMKQ